MSQIPQLLVGGFTNVNLEYYAALIDRNHDEELILCHLPYQNFCRVVKFGRKLVCLFQ